MKRTALALMAVMGLMCTAALAEDFNLVAYTGHYNSAYPTGTIEDLTYIPVGPNDWQRITMPDGTPKQHEIFLYISTDGTEKGVGGIDLSDPNTQDVPGTGSPGSRPSGVFGDQTFTTIQNKARWQFPPAPGSWVKLDDEVSGNAWNGYFGYAVAPDTWYFDPFGQFALGAVIEDPSPPPGNTYEGDFYRAVALQWNSTVGWTDDELGMGGVLVPYLHLVVNTTTMTESDLGTVEVSGLPALIIGTRPSDYWWLGQHIDGQEAAWVPQGFIEFAVLPEPASLGLLALGGLPLLWRRRR